VLAALELIYAPSLPLVWNLLRCGSSDQREVASEGTLVVFKRLREFAKGDEVLVDLGSKVEVAVRTRMLCEAGLL